MGGRLEEGGLLVEGTSDPTGARLVVHLLRKRGGVLRPEGLLFSVRLRSGFAPAQLQPVLPKALVHRVAPGQPIHAFMGDWEAAWLARRHLGPFGPRQQFVASCRDLAGAWSLDPRRWLARRGYLVLRDPVL